MSAGVQDLSESSISPTSGSVSLGEQVRQLRVAAGLTQGELASRTGSTQPAIAHLERGRRTPTLLTLRKLAQALGRDVTLTVPCDRNDADCRLS